MKDHTIKSLRKHLLQIFINSKLRKLIKVNIWLPKHNSAIYEDFSKILFEYENSYQRAFEVSFKN